MEIIDSHVHFLDHARRPLPWAATSAQLSAPLGPSQYRLSSPSTSAVVHIEAGVAEDYRTTEVEDVAQAALDWPAIVGQVAGDAPADADRSTFLDGISPGAHLAGVRVFLPDLRAGQLASLAGELAHRDLVLELLIGDHSLGDLPTLIGSLPLGLRVVLDHAAEPPIDAGWRSAAAHDWQRIVDQLARRELTAIKLTGMATRTLAPWEERVEPFARHVLTSFGGERAMYGSDWPICMTRARSGPTEWLNFVVEMCSGPGEVKAVTSGTAARIYALTIAR